jgi:hypothetical protein
MYFRNLNTNKQENCSRAARGVDKVCHCLATGLWFSPGTLLSSTNKTDCHNITEILLKVAFVHE